MPGWLALIAVGIVLVCAAEYVAMPSAVRSICMFIGVVCLIFGALLFGLALLALAGVRLPG